MKTFVVVNHPSDFKIKIPGVQVISAKTYLTDLTIAALKKARVYNLCRSYRYQRAGYYVSLLAAARDHKAVPDITTIQDVKTGSLVKLKSEELDALIKRSFKNLSGNEKTIDIFFGRTLETGLEELCKQIYQVFQAPLLRAVVIKSKDQWILHSVSILSAGELEPDHESYLENFAREYFTERKTRVMHKSEGLSLAILYDPNEKEPPSNREALEKFKEAAERKGMSCQLITKSDYNILSEFDALFIRETTNVNHHTYRFARKAEMEKLIVVDDPSSIMKCSNKVYLAELLRCNGVPMPETFIITRENIDELPLHLDFPVILKQPDSAFSQGVSKVSDQKEYHEGIGGLLEKSDMVIAQAFMPTPYDWRVGIFDGKPLFACKYYMARDHWQIYNWNKENEDLSGDVETFRIEEVPHAVMAAALSATRLIGKGLYGVDLKEVNGYPYVIEVNDNPNIDAGTEDKILENKLYSKIIDVFTQRIGRLRHKSVPA